jgi:hypothetical protein
VPELREPDDEGGGRGEARHDGVRQEGDDDASAQQAEAELEHADHDGQQPGEADELGAAGLGQGADAGERQQRHDRHGTDRQRPR